jgi:5-methylcytosine-specific restriction endonuclease McrA
VHCTRTNTYNNGKDPDLIIQYIHKTIFCSKGQLLGGHSTMKLTNACIWLQHCGQDVRRKVTHYRSNIVIIQLGLTWCL